MPASKLNADLKSDIGGKKKKTLAAIPCMTGCFQTRRTCHTEPCCRWICQGFWWRCFPRRSSSATGHAVTTWCARAAPWSRRSSWCPARAPLEGTKRWGHSGCSSSQMWWCLRAGPRGHGPSEFPPPLPQFHLEQVFPVSSKGSPPSICLKSVIFLSIHD